MSASTSEGPLQPRAASAGTRALLLDLVGALRSIAANQRISNLLAYRRQLVAQGVGRQQLEGLDEALAEAGIVARPPAKLR